MKGNRHIIQMSVQCFMETFVRESLDTTFASTYGQATLSLDYQTWACLV